MSKPPTAPPVRYDLVAPALPTEGPIALPSYVPGDGPIEIDVGFGRGHSLFERAEAAPATRIVGLEVKAKWVVKVAERLTRRGFDHVRVFRADARDVLARAEPAGSVARISLHFPDPWWKKRHGKRVLLDRSFAASAARLLAPGGALYVQTDVEERAAEYVAAIRETGAFELEGVDGRVEANPFGARSNRELRAGEDGLPVYRILARRSAGVVASAPSEVGARADDRRA